MVEFALKLLAYGYIPLMVLSIIGSIVMTAATYVNKKMRTSCHLLIVLLCTLDTLHNLAQVPMMITVIFEIRMRQSTCFYWESFVLPGALAGSFVSLSIGIERLLAVLLPRGYGNFKRDDCLYTVLLLIVPLPFTVYEMFIAFRSTTDDIIFPCGVPPSLGPQAFENFVRGTFVSNSIIVVLYLLVWKLVTKNGGHCRPIFKSLLITVFLVVFGWCTTMGINSLAFVLIKDHRLLEIVQQYAGIPVNVACASNSVVFYCISSDYRKSIRSVVCGKKKMTTTSSKIHPSRLNTDAPCSSLPNADL